MQKQIRVLQVVGVMNRGGAEVMLMDIFRHTPQGVQFDFLVNSKTKEQATRGVFDEEIEQRGARLFSIGTQWSMGLISYIRQFRRIVKCTSPDIVHIHLNAKGGVIALAARISGVKKVIVHCHADIRFRGSIVSRFVNEVEMFFQKILIGLFATDYWGCSVEANQRLFWAWLQRKTRVINNAVNTEAYMQIPLADIQQVKRSYRLSSHTLVLGNIGRVVSHKNIAFIIEILAVLKSKNVDASFVFAGRVDDKEYYRRIIENAEQAGVSDRVVCLGDREDVPVVMHTFDFFVGPALREGFGLVAVEAQAAGIPCLLYKGFPHTVDMNVGLVRFFDELDATQWAEALLSDKNNKRPDKQTIQQQIRAMGFDSCWNSEKVINLYLK